MNHCIWISPYKPLNVSILVFKKIGFIGCIGFLWRYSYPKMAYTLIGRYTGKSSNHSDHFNSLKCCVFLSFHSPFLHLTLLNVTLTMLNERKQHKELSVASSQVSLDAICSDLNTPKLCCQVGHQTNSPDSVYLAGEVTRIYSRNRTWYQNNHIWPLDS